MNNSTSIEYGDALGYVDKISKLASDVRSLPKASENAGFQQLEALGLCGDFPATFDSGVEEIASYIDTVSVGCNSYLTAVHDQDQSLYDKFQAPQVFVVAPFTPGGRSGGGGGGGGGGSHSNSNGNCNGGNCGNVTPSAVKALNNEDEEKATMDNTDKQEQYLSEISMDELDILITLLKNISKDENVELDKLFDEKYADLIKEKMLSELKISEEFRAMIDEGTSISLVTALKSLVDGKLDTFKVDPVMASTLINAVDLYATKNDTTYNDLVSESGDVELLKGAMTDFTKLNSITNSVNELSIQDKLLAIYEGNEVNSESSDVIKGYIDALSENSGTDYESLLTDSAFKEKVYDETNALNRVTKYADLLSCCSKDQIINSLKEISSKKNGSSGSSSSSSSSTKSNSSNLSTGSKDFVFTTEPLVVLEM